jgi:hypothetical protein
MQKNHKLMLRHIVCKLLKVKDKEQNLNAAGEKTHTFREIMGN